MAYYLKSIYIERYSLIFGIACRYGAGDYEGRGVQNDAVRHPDGFCSTDETPVSAIVVLLRAEVETDLTVRVPGRAMGVVDDDQCAARCDGVR